MTKILQVFAGILNSTTEQRSFFIERVDVISGIQSKMFGGKSYLLRGSVSLALVILILLMITLLVSEENPLRTSLFEVKRQFSASSSSGISCFLQLQVYIARHKYSKPT